MIKITNANFNINNESGANDEFIDNEFHPKYAYISGASRGIGKAVAIEFAKSGYNLALSCKKRKSELESLSKALEKDFHIKVITFIGDVSDFTFMENMYKEIEKNFPHIDCVVNNAGISYTNLITETPVEKWQEVINTNLSSIFYSTKLFVPKMIKRKIGSIINISSMWGRVGASMEVSYSASKGGVNAFTMALAKELAPSNISVNALACGVIDTDMNKMYSEDEISSLINEIPFSRLGTPEEVAKCCLFLSNSPKYLTGQIIGVDGGFI